MDMVNNILREIKIRRRAGEEKGGEKLGRGKIEKEGRRKEEFMGM
jgi:hypothetical protein